jgi:hypothetical protein
VQIEVFKTNVEDLALASRAVQIIAENFAGYRANFDLGDCDRILRVVSSDGEIHSMAVIEALNRMGCFAEILSG